MKGRISFLFKIFVLIGMFLMRLEGVDEKCPKKQKKMLNVLFCHSIKKKYKKRFYLFISNILGR